MPVASYRGCFPPSIKMHLLLPASSAFWGSQKVSPPWAHHLRIQISDQTRKLKLFPQRPEAFFQAPERDTSNRAACDLFSQRLSVFRWRMINHISYNWAKIKDTGSREGSAANLRSLLTAAHCSSVLLTAPWKKPSSSICFLKDTWAPAQLLSCIARPGPGFPNDLKNQLFFCRFSKSAYHFDSDEQLL